MICFMNENPKFYAVVEFDGAKIATVKAKTPGDDAEILDRCYHKKIVAGELEWEIDFGKMDVIRVCQALTGDPKVGWESDIPVTEDNVKGLLPDHFKTILAKVKELDKSWADGDILKN